MDTENQKEIAEEQMIEQAFQELLNDYLATKHRKRIEIITKAFNFANQAHKGIKRRPGSLISCTPLPSQKSYATKSGLVRLPFVQPFARCRRRYRLYGRRYRKHFRS